MARRPHLLPFPRYTWCCPSLHQGQCYVVICTSERDNTGLRELSAHACVSGCLGNLPLFLNHHVIALCCFQNLVARACSEQSCLSLQAFTQMHDSETRAEEVYKIVIQKYPKSVKVLKAYVRFLRDIKNDPWKAQKYDLQAENYDQVSLVTAGLPC